MKKPIPIFIILFFLATGYQTRSQQADTASYPYWIEMMQDPSANFYDVQRAFNTFWKDREVIRSNGWKQFKRWEYLIQNRILPDGTRPAPDQVWNEYFAYLEKNRNGQNFGNWVNLGPFNVPQARGYQGLGRINAVAFDPIDPNLIYIGAPSGGLWKSTDYGENWIPLTDMLPTLGVSSIAIDYTDPSIIYIGTGDRDAGDAPGLGVMKSFDGGLTWTDFSNGMDHKTVGRLIMHPDDPLMILAATSGGLYKTIDGGNNWYKTRNGDHKDVLFKVNDPSTVFCTAGGKLYRSEDTGENWLQVSNGIVGGARGTIGVTPANPEVVYFFTTTSTSYKGIYRSTDGGLSFTEMSTSPNIMSWGCDGGDGGQAWYDLDMAVDEQDENTIYAGGVNCFKSTDGGATWFIVSHWWGDCGVPAVHADLHVLEYNPHNGHLFAGNDGGIYYTDNDGTSWTEVSNGLAISQTYKLGQSATVKDLVINGYQDNGTSTYTGNAWYAVFGGDGMECAIDSKDERYSYATLYFGSIFRMIDNANAIQVAGENIGSITETGAWVTPFILDEGNPATMFVGYKNVWRCSNVKVGQNWLIWKKISENEGSDAGVLEQSPANPDILYVVRGNTLKRTDQAHDDSPIWYDISCLLPNNSGISDVEAHPFIADIVYMTQGNRVYKSPDKGQSWIDITGSLPDIYISGITYYTHSQEGLYVGTDAGMYYRDQSMDDWTQFSNGFPIAGRVSEIEIYYDEESPANDMIHASTYGRGLWESAPFHGMPVAGFTVDMNVVPAGCGINFTDLSLGVPTSWHWTFEGAVDPTSYDRDPSGVIYENAGTYPVKLVVSNLLGADSITKSGFITVSDALTPIANFGVDASSLCSNDPLATFSDSSIYCPVSWSWSFDPASVSFMEGTSAESQNPVVYFNETGNYSVTLIVSNTNGSSTLTREDYIHVGGMSLPITENFESGTFSTLSWSVINPDYNKTWEISNVSGSYPGNKAAMVNIFNYQVPPGQRDNLVSAPINLSGYENAYLTFRHAYAKKYPALSDSLIVYISDNCGDTWTRLLAAGENGTWSFATAPLTTGEFIPQSEEDWSGGSEGCECFTIDLTGWAGTQDVQVMFETFNYLGNNIYIDNVSIFTTVDIDEQDSAADLKVFPNPSTGIFSLAATGCNGNVEIKLLSLYGQMMLQKKLANITDRFSLEFDLSAYPKGLYILELITEKQVKAIKILID